MDHYSSYTLCHCERLSTTPGMGCKKMKVPQGKLSSERRTFQVKKLLLVANWPKNEN